MQFICKLAQDPKVFWNYGHDLLGCFHAVAETAADPVLSKMAGTAGVERAHEFRRLFPALPHDASANWVSMLAFGSYSADKLGVHDPGLKGQIRRAASRFSALDFLNFDPLREPPPSDVPEACPHCSRQNARGARICARCGAALTMQSRYDVWYDALITTYSGERYGVALGARYRDVLRWAPVMHPYRPRRGNPEFWSMIYAATHVVYTLNHYSKYLLAPQCLPYEFEFLKSSVPELIAADDPEALGELLDSLQSLGLERSDPLIRKGIEYLLTRQNPDGSWGDPNEKDPYDRYHPTWTAIGGLQEYKWKKVLCPEGLMESPRRARANVVNWPHVVVQARKTHRTPQA